MVEIIICDPDGIERLELGRRFHDNAPREMLVDGLPCDFVRFKAPGVAVYRRRPQSETAKEIAPTTTALSNRSSGRGNAMALRLVAQIVRATDNAPVGSLDLRSAELATSTPDLLDAWERLRRDGVSRIPESTPLPLSPDTLGYALVALRKQGFDWRLDGTRKRAR